MMTVLHAHQVMRCSLACAGVWRVERKHSRKMQYKTKTPPDTGLRQDRLGQEHYTSLITAFG